MSGTKINSTYDSQIILNHAIIITTLSIKSKMGGVLFTRLYLMFLGNRHQTA